MDENAFKNIFDKQPEVLEPLPEQANPERTDALAPEYDEIRKANSLQSRQETANIRKCFNEVFKQLGGVDEMVRWASLSPKNKEKFYSWMAKMLPKDVHVGEGNQITINIIQYGNPGSNNTLQIQAKGVSDPALPGGGPGGEEIPRSLAPENGEGQDRP